METHQRRRSAQMGSADENVFDIQQGVAIFHGVNAPGEDSETRSCADLWGDRESKYRILAESSIASIGYRDFLPTYPFLLFKSQNVGSAAEYDRGWKIPDMFQQGGMGIVTARDHVSISFDDQPLLRTATEFRDSSLSDKALCEQLRFQKRRAGMFAKPERYSPEKNLRLISYRYCYVRSTFGGSSTMIACVAHSLTVMRHMMEMKTSASLHHASKGCVGCHASRHVIGHKACAAYDVNCCPLLSWADRQRTCLLMVQMWSRLAFRLATDPNLSVSS